MKGWFLLRMWGGVYDDIEFVSWDEKAAENKFDQLRAQALDEEDIEDMGLDEAYEEHLSNTDEEELHLLGIEIPLHNLPYLGTKGDTNE